MSSFPVHIIGHHQNMLNAGGSRTDECGLTTEHEDVMKNNLQPDRKAINYGSLSLDEIQEGVSAEAVSYAAGLLVEAIRNYESSALDARKEKLTLTEAQMIAANLIAKTSAQLDDTIMQQQLARVRKAIREVKP